MKDIVDVFFVDYGNVARVTLNSEVKPIVNVAITELQTIAIPCSLRGVSVGSQWTERQTAQLHKILDAQPFTVSAYFKLLFF
jgi:Tudor domain